MSSRTRRGFLWVGLVFDLRCTDITEAIAVAVGLIGDTEEVVVGAGITQRRWVLTGGLGGWMVEFAVAPLGFGYDVELVVGGRHLRPPLWQ